MNRPAYWQLYLLLPAIVGLFVLERQLPLPEQAHDVLELAILLVVVALIALWIKLNERPLTGNVDRNQLPMNIGVYDPPRAKSPGRAPGQDQAEAKRVSARR